MSRSSTRRKTKQLLANQVVASNFAKSFNDDFNDEDYSPTDPLGVDNVDEATISSDDSSSDPSVIVGTPIQQKLINVKLTDPRIQTAILHDITVNRALYPRNRSLFPIVQTSTQSTPISSSCSSSTAIPVLDYNYLHPKEQHRLMLQYGAPSCTRAEFIRDILRGRIRGLELRSESSSYPSRFMVTDRQNDTDRTVETTTGPSRPSETYISHPTSTPTLVTNTQPLSHNSGNSGINDMPITRDSSCDNVYSGRIHS